MSEDYLEGYNPQNSYQKQLDAIRKQQSAEEQRLRDQSANLIRQYEAQKPVLKQRFTDNAQDAYVQKMNTLKEMPQVLAAQGYNGGLSESSNIKVDNQYGNAYNSHQKDYNEGLSNVDNQISNANASLNDMLAQNSINYSGLISNAEMSYQQMLMQAQKEEQALKLQEQVRLQEEKKWQQQFEYQKEQDRLANEYKQQQAAYSKQQAAMKSYSDTQSDAEKEQRAALQAELKNPVVQNFIKVVKAKTPTGNVKDPKTGQIITPTDQILMSIRENRNAGYLTEQQALAIMMNFGLAM